MSYRSNIPAIAEFTFQHRDPEFRKRQAQGSLETWKDPEYREKISRARREQHARGQGGHAVGHDDA